MPATCIEIIPMGLIEEFVIYHLKKIIQERFEIKAFVAKEHALPVGTYNSKRRQYNSRTILLELSNMQDNMQVSGNAAIESGEENPDKCKKRLAVVDHDLYSDGLNYVFGQAILNGCCAIISLARLRVGIETVADSRSLFLSRAEKEAVHELGHVFGLRHCPDPSCVMYLSGNIADTDAKSSMFCSRCSFLPVGTGFRRMN